MNYFHDYLDEFSAGRLRREVSRLNHWGDSEFSDGVVERLPGYDTNIKASALVDTDLGIATVALIRTLAVLAASRLQMDTTYFTAEALRYDVGVGLAIHNDFDYEGSGYPGGRVIIQLSDLELRGGEFELHQRMADQKFEPILTCETTRSHLVGFVVSEDSFHSVQPVDIGRRVSIVLNLWSSGVYIPSALSDRLWKIPPPSL